MIIKTLAIFVMFMVSTPIVKGVSNTTQKAASVTFLKREHNYTDKNGYNTIRLHFSLDINGCKDEKVTVIAYVYHGYNGEGPAVHSTLSGYKTVNNYACSRRTYTPRLVNSVYERTSLTIPYPSLNHLAGTNRFSCHLVIKDKNNRTIGTSGWVNFGVTYKNPSSPIVSASKKYVTGSGRTQATANKHGSNIAAYPPSIGSDAIFFKTSQGGISRCKITSNGNNKDTIIYHLWPYEYYLGLRYCNPGETIGFRYIGSKNDYYIFRAITMRMKVDLVRRPGFNYNFTYNMVYTPLDIYAYIAHDFSWVKAGNIKFNRRITKAEFTRLEQADHSFSESVNVYTRAVQEYTNELRNITNDLKNNPSGGSYRKSKTRKNTTPTRSTCTKCGGSGYETARYDHAAASASGWKQPYHNHGGTTCPVCSYKTEHYHYPCTECFGYGHIRK